MSAETGDRKSSEPAMEADEPWEGMLEALAEKKPLAAMSAAQVWLGAEKAEQREIGARLAARALEKMGSKARTAAAAEVVAELLKSGQKSREALSQSAPEALRSLAGKTILALGKDDAAVSQSMERLLPGWASNLKTETLAKAPRVVGALRAQGALSAKAIASIGMEAGLMRLLQVNSSGNVEPFKGAEHFMREALQADPEFKERLWGALEERLGALEKMKADRLREETVLMARVLVWDEGAQTLARWRQEGAIQERGLVMLIRAIVSQESQWVRGFEPPQWRKLGELLWGVSKESFDPMTGAHTQLGACGDDQLQIGALSARNETARRLNWVGAGYKMSGRVSPWAESRSRATDERWWSLAQGMREAGAEPPEWDFQMTAGVLKKKEDAEWAKAEASRLGIAGPMLMGKLAESAPSGMIEWMLGSSRSLDSAEAAWSRVASMEKYGDPKRWKQSEEQLARAMEKAKLGLLSSEVRSGKKKAASERSGLKRI